MDKITENLKLCVEKLIKGQENATSILLECTMKALMLAERKSFLKENVDDDNKGNGFYSRKAQGLEGQIDLQVPRDRKSLFKPALLESIKEKDEHTKKLISKLYVKGLSTREIGEIIEEAYGKRVSATTVSNITKSFEEEKEAWCSRPLEEEYYVIYIDAIFVPLRRGGTVAYEAFYIAMGLRKDLKRDILGVYNNPSESASVWEEILYEFKTRGMKQTLLIVADGLKGLDLAAVKTFPKAKFQRCVVHKKRNILNKVRPHHKAEIAADLKRVFKVGDPNHTLDKAKQELELFIEKWRKIYPKITRQFNSNEIDYYFSYLSFPAPIQKMIYTTNWIERLNETIRRTQRFRRSMPSAESAMSLICGCVIERQEKFYWRYPVTEGFADARPELNKMLKKLTPKTQFS